MSKPSDTPAVNDLRVVHLRVYYLERECFQQRGGVTLCYSASEDRRWMRVGASWCSLQDMYTKNRELEILTQDEVRFLTYLNPPSDSGDEFNRESAKRQFIYKVVDEAPTPRVKGLALRWLVSPGGWECGRRPLPWAGEQLHTPLGEDAARRRYLRHPVIVHVPPDWWGDNGQPGDWNTIIERLNDEPARRWVTRALKWGLWYTWELRPWKKARKQKQKRVKSLEGQDVMVEKKDYGENPNLIRDFVLGQLDPIYQTESYCLCCHRVLPSEELNEGLCDECSSASPDGLKKRYGINEVAGLRIWEDDGVVKFQQVLGAKNRSWRIGTEFPPVNEEQLISPTEPEVVHEEEQSTLTRKDLRMGIVAEGRRLPDGGLEITHITGATIHPVGEPLC